MSSIIPLLELRVQRPNLKLLQIFPEEIWRKIFGLLSEPEDLENVFNTCSLFQNVFVNQRCSFLFPKVFKIIDSKYPFSCNEILNLRLVSHFWKFIVESTIQNRKSRYNFLYETDEYLNIPEELLNTFRDSTALSIYKGGGQYLNSLWTGLVQPFYEPQPNSTPRMQRKFVWSPVPSRHIIICDKHIPNQPENPEGMGVGNYRHPTFSLLGRLNVIDVVWFMDIWIRYSTPPRLWYSFILNWVCFYAPNLKVLQFKFPYQGTQQEISEIEQEVTIRPFQFLEHLRMLTLDSVPKSVTESLLDANKNIEMLQILRSNPQLRFDIRTDLLNGLKNLRKFSLSLFSELEFQRFEQINGPSLETLYLNLELLKIDWNRVFCVLEKFKSLKDLTLKLPVELEEKTDDKMQVPSFPCLKRLKLSMQTLVPVDFLLNFSSVEDLYLIINITTDYAKNQQVKLDGYYDCFEKSIIKSKIRSLKRVRLAVKTKESSEYCHHIYKKTDLAVLKTK